MRGIRDSGITIPRGLGDEARGRKEMRVRGWEYNHGSKIQSNHWENGNPHGTEGKYSNLESQSGQRGKQSHDLHLLVEGPKVGIIAGILPSSRRACGLVSVCSGMIGIRTIARGMGTMRSPGRRV